ncbi:MAG: ParB/RepB/Spo0J family partition protein [Candidatus Thorarchaeota archaeon]
MELKKIKLELIEIDKGQPRKSFKNIGDLASNIRKQGLINPLEVMEYKGKYKLIDGERRLKALQLMKREETDCIVHKKLDDVFLRQVSNDFHKNKLNLVEQAEAIEKLLKLGFEKDYICNQLGIKHTGYYSRLKILKLSPKSRQYIIDGQLNLRDIHNLNELEIAEQEKVIDRIIKEKPKSETRKREIVLEETDLNYIINKYTTACYSFENKLKSFDERIIFYKDKLNGKKKDLIKDNNYNLKIQIDRCKDNLEGLRRSLELSETNFA